MRTKKVSPDVAEAAAGIFTRERYSAFYLVPSILYCPNVTYTTLDYLRKSTQGISNEPGTDLNHENFFTSGQSALYIVLSYDKVAPTQSCSPHGLRPWIHFCFLPFMVSSLAQIMP